MSTCTNVDERGDECTREAFEGSPVSLCRIHLIVAAHFVKEMGGLGAAEVLMPEKVIEVDRQPRAHLKHGRPQCVYYIKLGNRVKIGTTTNLPKRLEALPFDTLLAIEPGGNPREHARHQQFAALRVNGEWFKADGVLMDHARQMRAEHGEPREAWERLATRRG